MITYILNLTLKLFLIKLNLLKEERRCQIYPTLTFLEDKLFPKILDRDLANKQNEYLN